MNENSEHEAYQHDDAGFGSPAMEHEGLRSDQEALEKPMTDRSPTSWTLAVDFGTSFTVAAVRSDGRPPEAIEIAGERRMPTVVMVSDDGSVLVGRAAEDLAASSPGRALRAPKRRLGEPAPVVLGGRAYQVVDLVAAVLRHVYDEAVRHQGSPPDSVRLTHPATWSRPRLARLLEAAAKAGLPQAVLIAEPVAAAMSYASEVGVADGAHVAVYDLGGGTFDTTVLQAEGGAFSVVGRPGGDANLGGELFDELLTNDVGERLDPDVWEQLQVSDDMRWRQAASALRTEVRRAKEALTSAPYAELLVPLPTGLVNLRLTRDELEAVVGPYIDESVRLFVQCVRDAGVEPSALAAVYLVGGASRMPLVERRLSEAVPGVPVSRRGDPKTAVALGATRAEPSGSVLDLQAAGGRTTLESDAGASVNALLAPPPAPGSMPPPPSMAPPSLGPVDGGTVVDAGATAFDPGTVVDAGRVVERGTVVETPRLPPPPGPAPVGAAPAPPSPAPTARGKGPILVAAGVVAALLAAGIGFAATRGGGSSAAPTTVATTTATSAAGGAPATLSPTLGSKVPTTVGTNGTPSTSTAPPATTTPGSPGTTPAPTTPATPAPTAPPTTEVAGDPVPPGLDATELNAAVLTLDDVTVATGLSDWTPDTYVAGEPFCGIVTPDAAQESHSVHNRLSGGVAQSIVSTSATYATLDDLILNYEALLGSSSNCPNPTEDVGGVTVTLTVGKPVESQIPLTDRALAMVITSTAPNGVTIQNMVGVVTKGRSAVILSYQILGRSLQQSDIDAVQQLLTKMTVSLVTNV